MGKIHKAHPKHKVNHYVGFGQYDLVPVSLCAGAYGYYARKKYILTRNWKNVTCKHCINKKGL